MSQSGVAKSLTGQTKFDGQVERSCMIHCTPHRRREHTCHQNADTLFHTNPLVCRIRTGDKFFFLTQYHESFFHPGHGNVLFLN